MFHGCPWEPVLAWEREACFFVVFSALRFPKSSQKLRKAPKDSPDKPKDTPEDATNYQKEATSIPETYQNVIKLELEKKAKTDHFRKSQKH